MPLPKDMVAALDRLKAYTVISLFVLPVMLISTPITSWNAAAYTLHAPIVLDGDSDFLTEDCVISGNGTAGNPYIIADWEINLASTWGIYVKNTRAFFVIRDVMIRNTSLFSAIKFDNVSDGTIESSSFINNSGTEIQLLGVQNISIRDCNFQNTGGNAILASTAAYVIIENITVQGSNTAIYFEQSYDIYMNNCTLENSVSSFISLLDCQDSKIENCFMRNSTFKGLELISSNNTIVKGNAIINSSRGIYLFNCQLLTFYGNMICLSRDVQVVSEGSTSIKWNTTYVKGNTTYASVGGNYWSNYIGPDDYSGESQNLPGSDGIIDKPYTLLAANVDTFPLYKPTLPDDTAPKSSANIIGGQKIGDWYKSYAIIEINSTDDFSGILNVSYAIDSSPFLEYKGSFSISDSGEHIVEFFATDRMFNNESTKNLVVRIDSMAPLTEAWLQGTEGNDAWYVSPVTIQINATDNESGVASTWYSLDAAATVPYVTYLIVSSEGYHNLAIYSTDEVGNTGIVNIVSISLDLEKPILNIEQSNGTIFTSIPVRISWSSSDSFSGLDHIEISVDGQGFSRIPALRKSFTMSGLSDGEHFVTILAFDKAGHVTERQVSFTVDAGISGLILTNLALIVALIIATIVIVTVLIIRKRIIRSRRLK